MYFYKLLWSFKKAVFILFLFVGINRKRSPTLLLQENIISMFENVKIKTCFLPLTCAHLLQWLQKSFSSLSNEKCESHYQLTGRSPCMIWVFLGPFWDTFLFHEVPQNSVSRMKKQRWETKFSTPHLNSSNKSYKLSWLCLKKTNVSFKPSNHFFRPHYYFIIKSQKLHL